jgi:hypothetical protein
MGSSRADLVNQQATQEDPTRNYPIPLRNPQEDQRMLEPGVVVQLRELSGQGLGSKRIARWLGISPPTMPRVARWSGTPASRPSARITASARGPAVPAAPAPRGRSSVGSATSSTMCWRGGRSTASRRGSATRPEGWLRSPTCGSTALVLSPHFSRAGLIVE